MVAFIVPGARVRMHFALHLGDGTLVDDSRESGTPLEFTLGGGELDAGLEILLLGLQAGDREHYALAPGDAFGEREPDNVHPMPRGDFPPELDLAPGAVVAFTTPAGDETAGTVVRIEEEQVLVDLNHPLAGRALSFAVEILEVAVGDGGGEG